MKFLRDIRVHRAFYILLFMGAASLWGEWGVVHSAELSGGRSVTLDRDGVCRTGNARTRFGVSVTLKYTNADACTGRSTQFCTDYLRGYIVDGTGKIVGHNQYAVFQGQSALVSVGVDITGTPSQSPFKIVIVDVVSAAAGQSTGQSYAGNTTYQRELFSRSFNPSALDPDCPKPPPAAETAEKQVQNLFDQSKDKTVDLGELKVIGKSQTSGDKTVDLGELKVIGKTQSSGDKTVDLGELKVIGKSQTSGDKTVDLGELKVIGKTQISGDKTVDLGELKVIGKTQTSGDKTVDLGELKVIGKSQTSGDKTIDLGELKVIGKTQISGDKTVDLGELKVIGKSQTSGDKTVDLGELKVIGKSRRAIPLTRSGRLPKRVKVSLVRVRKLSGETNPFDPVEVEADVTAAQNGTLNQNASNATALTVTTPAPFPTPVTPFCCGSATLAINAAGTTLTAASGPQPGFFVAMNRTFGVGDPHDYTLQPTFTLLSSTPGVITGLSDGTAVQLVVRRNSDNIIFQINVTTTYVPAFDTQLTTLSGFNCGTSAANCP